MNWNVFRPSNFRGKILNSGETFGTFFFKDFFSNSKTRVFNYKVIFVCAGDSYNDSICKHSLSNSYKCFQ